MECGRGQRGKFLLRNLQADFGQVLYVGTTCPGAIAIAPPRELRGVPREFRREAEAHSAATCQRKYIVKAGFESPPYQVPPKAIWIQNSDLPERLPTMKGEYRRPQQSRKETAFQMGCR